MLRPPVQAFVPLLRWDASAWGRWRPLKKRDSGIIGTKWGFCFEMVNWQQIGHFSSSRLNKGRNLHFCLFDHIIIECICVLLSVHTCMCDISHICRMLLICDLLISINESHLALIHYLHRFKICPVQRVAVCLQTWNTSWNKTSGRIHRGSKFCFSGCRFKKKISLPVKTQKR